MWTRVQIPAQPVEGYVTFGKLFHLSELQFYSSVKQGNNAETQVSIGAKGSACKNSGL